MNTPVYREMVRLLNNKMNVSRNTVYNWFVKGSDYLKKVLPVLKEKLLAKGAVVNCDETWCRVKVAGKLLADTSGMRGDLMHKALNYLNSFWNQLILYLKDGRYSIDRSSFARLLPTGRK